MLQSGPLYGWGVENRAGNRPINIMHVMHVCFDWDNEEENNLRLQDHRLGPV